MSWSVPKRFQPVRALQLEQKIISTDIIEVKRRQFCQFYTEKIIPLVKTILFFVASNFQINFIMFSVLESRTNVTEQKERILIKNPISYKLKYQAKEARLILQSGKQIFCYLLLCTLFVHFFALMSEFERSCKFCDFFCACEQSQSQLQILQNLGKLLPMIFLSSLSC